MDLFDFQKDETSEQNEDKKVNKLTVLDLPFSSAKKFFMSTSQYCSIDLPLYFDFEEILNKADILLNSQHIQKRKGTSYEKKYNGFIKKIKDCCNANHILMCGKGSRYSWRPLQLLNPYIYMSLVNLLTKEENWLFIKGCFEKYQKNKNILCLSLPILPEEHKSQKASQILNWWTSVEQESISTSLEFSYLFTTDITDFYPSIYTHSIAWAINGKSEAKKDHSWLLLGNAIDEHIQMMSNSQTNGIPQGSVLMDFIAEMILGYADEELTQKIENENETKIKDYKILRYRDDYRIFVNNPQEGEIILKKLTEVLMDLGLKLNSSKTQNIGDLITGSIKDDKLDFLNKKWMDLFYRNSINDGKDEDTDEKKKYSLSTQKNLLILYNFSKIHPNSGALKRGLTEFYNNLIINPNEDVKPLIAIASEIAFFNSQTYSIISALLSKFISLLKKEEKEKIIDLIIKKFERLPNTGFLDVWLQRISLPFKSEKKYSEKLCSLLFSSDATTELWNFNFLSEENKKKLNSTQIINKKQILNLPEIIQAYEFNPFEYND